MSFYLKNINDIFILNSDGKLGINKIPEFELDVFGAFYSEKINFSNLSGVDLNCSSGVSAKQIIYKENLKDFYDYITIKSTKINSGYTNISAENYSGDYFESSELVTGKYFYVTGSKLQTVTGDIYAGNLSGLNFKLNSTGIEGGIRGIAKTFTYEDTLKINSGYFSQNEIESFINQYNNLPINGIGAKQFASGQGTGDYWFDKEWISKFINIITQFNNQVISGHYSDRAGTVFYLPIPKTIKFFLCKCSGIGDDGDQTLTGCIENDGPKVCWIDCIENASDFRDCKHLLNTGVNIFNVSSSKPSFINANKSKTEFINFYNNTNLIFEKTFNENYSNRSPAVTLTSQNSITSDIFLKNIFWINSDLNKVKFYCEGSGCMNISFEGQYDAPPRFPLYKMSYITIA